MTTDVQQATDDFSDSAFWKINRTPVTPAPVDAEAEDWRKRHGYPIDAKRLPAGRYELSGLDAWNQPDPTSPDGVTMRARGDILELTAHEASRLLFVGAIRDPDVVHVTAASDHAAAIASAEDVRDKLLAQVSRFRGRYRDVVAGNAQKRERLQKALDELKTSTAEELAGIDASDAEARAMADASDAELAAKIGASFAATLAQVESTIATFRDV